MDIQTQSFTCMSPSMYDQIHPNDRVHPNSRNRHLDKHLTFTRRMEFVKLLGCRPYSQCIYQSKSPRVIGR